MISDKNIWTFHISRKDGLNFLFPFGKENSLVIGFTNVVLYWIQPHHWFYLTISNEVKVSCPRKQWETLMGLELTTDQIWVRRPLINKRFNRVACFLYDSWIISSYNNERSRILIFCHESLKCYNSLPFRHWVKVYVAKLCIYNE